MTRLRTVLAATDLSAPSRHAAARAARIASEADAALAFVHVLNGSALESLRRALGEQGAAVEGQLLESTRAELQRLAGAVGEPFGLTPSAYLGRGGVVAEIVARAEAIDADLLVLGARGAGFLRHILLGTTAERLLRKTLRPLLVVKQTAHEAYRRVLLPVDFSPWTLPAIDFARSVAPGAELVLVHACDVPFEGKMRIAGVDEVTMRLYRSEARREALERMRRLMTDASLEPGAVPCIVQHGDPSPLILEQEQEQDCDLIVMGKHGNSALEELLLGSVTKHVLAESSCDVLVATRAAG